MAALSPLVEHLLRRAGFGATPDERQRFAQYSYPLAVATLLEYDPATTGVDHLIGTPGYAGVTIRTAFRPSTNIEDARQRWLFRLVHSPAPLQEKMALFWHHHFATAYSKIAGIVGGQDATRMMAAVPSEDPNAARGQIELFRASALGTFRQLLVDVAQDIAMMYWLDGRLNTRALPQENFGRELMELFTFGVEHYTESDVYAAARVFTGWNIARTGDAGGSRYWQFVYRANQHDTNAKTFSFAVYPDGSRTIPGRPAADGMQDGFDLINALAIHPETARRMARRLWHYFVSEVHAPDPEFVASIAGTYLKHDTLMKPVIRAVLLSPQFTNLSARYARYGWPVEFVVRALKEVGHVGFSVDSARTPLVNMGQQLFEPPDVNGWDTGPGWFSTAGMLARMNFAATLATNQKFALREAARPFKQTPESLVDFVLSALTLPQPAPAVYQSYVDYVRAGGTWTGSETQLLNKAGGLFHLMTGSGDYQFV